MINLKEEFAPRKEKVCLFFREERKEVSEFIEKQTRMGYIWLSKSSQMVLMFFVERKNRKKKMV